MHTQLFLTNVILLGLAELKDELDQDFDLNPMKSLCISNGPSQFQNCCFLTAVPLDPIMEKYDFMSRCYPNDLFPRIWLQTSYHASKANSELTISDIVTKIWTPAFEECCRLLDSLKDCSIKLREVDDCFNNSNKIKFQLGQLHRGVEECLNGKPLAQSPPWIDSAVERMQQYWTLCCYAKAAQTVLEVRDKLKLTGDFSLMEAIAEKVCIHLKICGSDIIHVILCFGMQMSSSMKDKSLDVIDQSLIDAGEFLAMVEEDKRKLDCLRTFADSLDVVEWIRSETKGTFMLCCRSE